MKNLGWIIKEIIPFWPRVCLALLLSALTITSHVGLMATSSYLLARAALHPPLMDLMVTIVGVRFFGISRAVFRYFERLVSHDVTFRVLSRIRVIVYEGIEPLLPAYLKDLRKGDLLSRIVGDVEVQQNLFLRVLAPPLVAVLVLIGYGGFLAHIDLGFTYILAAVFLTAGVALPFLIRIIGQGIGQRKVQAKAKMHTFVLDMLQGMPEMLAFGQTQAMVRKIREAQNDLSQSDRKMARVTGISNALMGMSANLGMLAVLVLGILFVEKEQLDGILLGMLALGVLSSFEALSTMPVIPHYYEESIVAGQRLKNLVDEGQKLLEQETHERIDYKQAAKAHSVHSPVIEFRNVSFRYHADEPQVLHNLSFKIPIGSRVAIVGPSGAGKSSVVNLLLRFWEPDSGEIYIDGVNIKELSSQEVRARMGVVTQTPHLFHATVKENLLLAKPEATDEEIQEAARRAKIHESVHTLPQGYDSLIGEEGMKLSGGQQQRLAIARALLKDAPILILDEATTGLDPVTEQELRKEILALMKGKTLIVITHQLELAKDMDEILVFKQGSISERGNHDDLLRLDRDYKHLWTDS
ncbi:cysteine export CydDC family ABC transporter permease subunit/ATP-binding protein CydC [Desulfitobacterium dichloroeliminans LMG P-21439]|uniref:Cysteine export CydDC family ABC transporter permease subunit/ATP-binding protein CydC n=1 Tax=Desulfitobacterium dichloroeliminans (strain LMG P-21439 / DCA1) TaxID=871963 RepID=L0F6J0_DESDL|nr:thiol reductant ABC exporter subunit CydC [Desulfitobacterium dichloroeliminans]AGA68553.1 cysteine export CydDC family ABC transporter permease subunit/ATP-binding protein CydC [Desulfitobacterium dichloroeliminans LMG P-21439]